jgi:hypothetical protein
VIYLFTGTDVAKARAKAFAWVSATRAKAPEAVYIRLEAKEITPQTLMEIAGSQGLFFSKTLALLDDPFSVSETGELVLETLPMLASSTNAIGILAPKLLATRLKKIETKAEKVFTFDSLEKKPARGFNSALVNALGTKDRQVLWKELLKAERLGEAPEALHGLLHWKARDMMQKGSSVWGKEGARKLSRELIELVSDARSGTAPLKESLERFALSLR